MTVYLLRSYRFDHQFSPAHVAGHLAITIDEYRGIEDGTRMPSEKEMILLASLYNASKEFIKRACWQTQRYQGWERTFYRQVEEIKKLKGELQEVRAKR